MGQVRDEEKEGQEKLEGGEWHHQEVIVSFDYFVQGCVILQSFQKKVIKFFLNKYTVLIYFV